MPANNLFFFYGTLMSGEYRTVPTGMAELIGPATIRGQLHSVGHAFPALSNGPGIVTGELWRGNEDDLPALIARLDSIEGYRPSNPARSMYLREERCLLEPEVRAWVYIWNEPTYNLKPIPSGDWRQVATAY
jgi:gamma-glutamylcyclotransferase (GGCT)/AIG2-like uncharacterized protein YtfP